MACECVHDAAVPLWRCVSGDISGLMLSRSPVLVNSAECAARAREREPQNERICLVCSTRARVHGCSWDAEVTIDAEIRGFSIGEECGGDDD